MSAFQETTAAGLAAIDAVAGRTITYRRGGDSVQITEAVRGESRFEAQDVEGLTTRVRVGDYLFDADKLLLDSQQTEPRAGDEIDDGTETFEVYSPGGAEEAFRYSDHARTRLRVHTRQI